MICVDCKWHEKEVHLTVTKRIFTDTTEAKEVHVCKWKEYKWDCVTGEKVWSEPRNEDCYHARDPEEGFCRPEALYFIPK